MRSSLFGQVDVNEAGPVEDALASLDRLDDAGIDDHRTLREYAKAAKRQYGVIV